MPLTLTLSCIVSELQALQHATARLVSSLQHHAYNPLLTLTLSCIVSELQALQDTTTQRVTSCTPCL